MSADAEAYGDYRYELQVAASLARADGQRVLRLAGKGAGPDIEFTAQSGERCGVACYRARRATPTIAQVSNACMRVSHGFCGVFADAVDLPDCGVEVIFPMYRVTEEQVAAAVSLLRRACEARAQPEFSHITGVVVRRCVRLAPPRLQSIRRWARLRFVFPTPDGERVRIDRHIQQKADSESARWAARFDGYPILSVEQSPFAADVGAREVFALLSDRGTSIRGCFSTRMQHFVKKGIAHGIEDVSVFAPGLDLGICTFGANSDSWAQGGPVVLRTDAYACEFWDVWEDYGGVSTRRARSLDVARRMTRLDTPVASLEELRRRPDVIEQVAEVVVRHQDDAGNAFDW